MPDNLPTTQDSELPPVPIQRQKNIPIETLIKLHKKNLSHTQIAKIVGCNTSNVTARFKRAGITSLRAYKDHRADVFASIQTRILNNISEEDIKKAPLGSKTLAVCQLYDKERLERDKSTHNITSIHAVVAAIKAQEDKE